MALLFGPDWDVHGWTASDDRVRGGSSISSLVPIAGGVLFHGNLDIETLGGAGFASQRTVGHEDTWDLSGNDGIELEIISSDNKLYTFSVTDEIAQRRPDGREQSSLVWEYDFRTTGTNSKVRVSWGELKSTYRGKPVENARQLDVSQVKRFRIMARSFFGEQQGSFDLKIRSIASFRETYLDNPTMTKERITDLDGNEYEDEEIRSQRKWSLCCLF